MWARAAAGWLCWACGSAAGQAVDLSAQTAAPQRVVSMNLCADELVLRLAAPGTVRSVTWLARDPSISTVTRQASDVPVNRGLAEEIVPLQPDLVVAGTYTTRTTVALLERLQVPLLELDVPQTLPAAMRQIRQVADALGRSEQGKALVADMEAGIARVESEQRKHVHSPLESSPKPVAAVYSPMTR